MPASLAPAFPLSEMVCRSQIQYKREMGGPTPHTCTGHSFQVPGRQERRREWHMKRARAIGQWDKFVCGCLKTQWELLRLCRNAGKCIIGRDQPCLGYVREKEATLNVKCISTLSRFLFPRVQFRERSVLQCCNSDEKTPFGAETG